MSHPAVDAWLRKRELRYRAYAPEGLLKRLMPLKGTSVGAWRWLEPFSIGGQSLLVLVGRDADNALGVCKFASMPYHKPIGLSRELIGNARASIRTEAVMLEKFGGRFLPRLLDSFEAENPLLPPQLPDELRSAEPFVVMELIEGETLDAIRARRHGKKDIDAQILDGILFDVAKRFAEFTQELEAQSPPLLYTDICPDNVWTTSGHPSGVVFVDGASVVPASSRAFPFKAAYAAPDVYRAIKDGEPFALDYRIPMYALAKTLHSVATNATQTPGSDPDLEHPDFLSLSKRVRRIISGGIEGKFDSFESLQVSLELPV